MQDEYNSKFTKVERNLIKVVSKKADSKKLLREIVVLYCFAIENKLLHIHIVEHLDQIYIYKYNAKELLNVFFFLQMIFHQAVGAAV